MRCSETEPQLTQILIAPPVLSFYPGILAKIDTLLAAAGTDKSKLISAQIWVKDISQHFKPMNKVWCAWLDPKAKPVRATVEPLMTTWHRAVDRSRAWATP